MPAPTPRRKVADLVAYQNRAPMTWKHVERYRELWKGNFVLKGIMHPDDAIRAHSLGVDGIMVSNHGARQLDNAPSPLEVLPAIRDAVGDKMTVMFDGGIRRGLDAVIALCMGAKFVFVGRPTLYGVTAGGIPGATRRSDLPPRDRPQHGADGRHQDLRPRPAVPDVEGRGGFAPQPALMRTVDFYLGLGSRYSYLAASQVERIEKTWLPLRLETDRQRRADGSPRRQPFPCRANLGQYDWGYREYDAHAGPSTTASRFANLSLSGWTLQRSHWPVWPRIGRARWCRAVACCSNSSSSKERRSMMVSSRASPRGWACSPQAFRRDLQAPDTQARHTTACWTRLQARGAFGVPTFFLGERMFWGNDRLMLLEAALGGKAMPEIRR